MDDGIKGGVGMRLSHHALKPLKGIQRIQLRSMYASFNGNYATNATDISTFYNNLSFIVWHIPKYNVWIISGDINAQIGKDRNNKFCLYNLPNRNVEYLADFFPSRTGQNTEFKKMEGKLWTNTHPNNSLSQLSYIFINNKWMNSALNCETYSSFEGVVSNQRIISAKICRVHTEIRNKQLKLHDMNGLQFTNKTLTYSNSETSLIIFKKHLKGIF